MSLENNKINSARVEEVKDSIKTIKKAEKDDNKDISQGANPKGKDIHDLNLDRRDDKGIQEAKDLDPSTPGNALNGYSIFKNFLNTKDYPDNKYNNVNFSQNIIDFNNYQYSIKNFTKSFLQLTTGQANSITCYNKNDMTNTTSALNWMPNIADNVILTKTAEDEEVTVTLKDADESDYMPDIENVNAIEAYQSNMKRLESFVNMVPLNNNTRNTYFPANNTGNMDQEVRLNSDMCPVWRVKAIIGCSRMNRTWENVLTDQYNLINRDLQIGDNVFKMARLTNDNYATNHRTRLMAMIYNGVQNSPRKFNPSYFLLRSYMLLNEHLFSEVNTYAAENSHGNYLILPKDDEVTQENNHIMNHLEGTTINVKWTDIQGLETLLQVAKAQTETYYILPIPSTLLRNEIWRIELLFMLIPSGVLGKMSIHHKGIRPDQDNANNNFTTHGFCLGMCKLTDCFLVDGFTDILLVEYDIYNDQDRAALHLPAGNVDIEYANTAALLQHRVNLLPELLAIHNVRSFDTVLTSLTNVLAQMKLHFFETDFKFFSLISQRYLCNSVYYYQSHGWDTTYTPLINLLCQPAHGYNDGYDFKIEVPDWKQWISFHIGDFQLYSENIITFTDAQGFHNLKFMYGCMYAASIEKFLSSNFLDQYQIIETNNARFNVTYKPAVLAMWKKYGFSEYIIMDFDVFPLTGTYAIDEYDCIEADKRISTALYLYTDVLEWLEMQYNPEHYPISNNMIQPYQILKYNDVQDSKMNYTNFNGISYLNLCTPQYKDILNKFNSYLLPHYFIDEELRSIRYDVFKSRQAINQVPIGNIERLTLKVITATAFNFVNHTGICRQDLHFLKGEQFQKLRLSPIHLRQISVIYNTNLCLIQEGIIIKFNNSKIHVREQSDWYDINDEQIVQRGIYEPINYDEL